MKYFLLTLALLSCIKTQAQIPCAADLANRHALQNEGYAQKHQALEHAVFNFFKTKNPQAENTGAVQTIPVVVHIIHDNGPENIPDTQVEQAVQWLNQALANAGPFDRGSGADTEVQLCLARRTPDNKTTAGITRTQNPLTVVADILTDDPALKNLSRWNPKDYLNIWVVRSICSNTLGCGVAAYAYRPAFHGSNVDGIVIEAAFFGSTAGYTAALAHELGHYLGLYHTFEGNCKNDDCLQDGDRVCDTPPDQSTASVPCSQTVNTCSTDTKSGFTTDQPDMSWNFMDYGDYNCLHDFTPGQAARMQFFLNGARKSLLSSKGCLPPCQTPVTAAFTASATNVPAGTTVSFTNQSQQFSSLEWTVNSTPFSTAPNPAYLFAQPGVYTVQLTAQATDPAACESESAMLVIQVQCPVTAAFEISDFYPLVDEPVTVTNTSQNATQFEWFLNGVSQGAALSTLTFSSSGSYTLVLKATNGFCTKTFEHLIVVRDSCLNPGFQIQIERGYSKDGVVQDNNIILLEDGNLLVADSRFYSTYAKQLRFTKMQPDGTILWSKTVGDSTRDTAPQAVCSTPDNGFAVVYAKGPPRQYGVMKFSADGKLEWQREVKDASVNLLFLTQLTSDSEGNILVTGWAFSSPHYHIVLLKCDAAGNLSWIKRYGSYPINKELGYAVAVMPDSGYVVWGYTLNGSDSEDGVLLKVSSSGALIWKKVVATGAVVSNFRVLPLPDNSVYLGCTDKTTGFQVLVQKVGPDGKTVWARQFGPADGTPLSLIDLEYGPGNTIQAIAFSYGAGNTYLNYLIRADSTGQLAFARLLKKGANWQSNDLAVAPDGAQFIVGSILPDFFQNDSAHASFLIKIDTAGFMGACYAPEVPFKSTPVSFGDYNQSNIDYPPPLWEYRANTEYAHEPEILFVCPPDCYPLAEICNNQLDDDNDGLFDCLDPDCDCPDDPCNPKQANTWYFGKNSGLDFSTEPPSVLTDGQADNTFAAAVANDAAGNLLFYTDGKTVFNRFHQPMPNGQDLAGTGLPNARAAHIVPHPGKNGLFYVFHTAPISNAAYFTTAYYSVVDMQLDGGKGAVVAGQKGLLLFPAGSRIQTQFAVVKTCEPEQYWVVFRNLSTPGYRAFRIDTNGLNTVGVHSSTALQHGFSTGQLKFSPDGRMLAEADAENKRAYVYDFDPATGNVSAQARYVASFSGKPFGLEFSPGGRFLYLTDLDDMPPNFINRILQLDLEAAAGPDISAQATVLATRTGMTSPAHYGALQLAPDGKIYVSNSVFINTNKPALHVIHYPDRPGAACQFQENGLPLAPAPGAGPGLCNFPSNYFATPQIAFPQNQRDTFCTGNEAKFRLRNVSCLAEAISWKLENLQGDIISEKKGEIAYQFSSAGQGQLIATAQTPCGQFSDTLNITVLPEATAVLDLGPDQLVCDNGVFTFRAGPGFERYRWQDGSPDSVYTTLFPGTYWVEVWDRCGNRQTDTITVSIAPATVLELGPDYQQCPGAAVDFTLPAVFDRWKWAPATGLNCDTCASITAAPATTTTYRVIAQTDAGCVSVDSVAITVQTILYETLDTVACSGSVIEIFGQNLPADTTAEILLPASGPGHCDTLWTVTVAALPAPTVSLPPDTTLRIGEQLQLEAAVNGTNGPFEYSWVPPQGLDCSNCPAPIAAPETSTVYTLQVLNNLGCAGADSILITVDSSCTIYRITAFTPNSDGVNDWFFPKTDPCIRLVRRWLIFNRWGELILEKHNFEPNQANLGWDGGNHPSDVYIWVAEFEYFNGKIETIRGDVALLR